MIKKEQYNKWISLSQAVQYSSLSKSTLRRAIAKGELKASKTTGKLLFKINEIDRWLNG